jgi:PEP-CTERM motif
MKLLLRATLLSAAITSLTPLAANAVILVEPIVTTQNEDVLKTRNPRKLPPEILPGQIIEYGVPDKANNLLNATGRDMGSFVFDLKTLSYTNPNSTPAFNNEPVQWGDVDGDGKIGFSNIPGLQDIFQNVDIQGSVLTYSGGVIPNGTVFFNRFFTNPDLTPGGGIIPSAPPPPADQDGPIRMGAYYTAIPEPSSVLGMLALGALGAGLQFKKHKNKKQLA